MTIGWRRLGAWGMGVAAALWISKAGAQAFSDPFAPAAGSVSQNAEDAAKPAAPAAEPKPAADAKPVAKPKAPKPRSSSSSLITVVINNKRSVGLVELTAALAGSSDAKKIAGPLAANRKTIAHLKRDKACLFDLKGSYADGADLDISSVELCKDKTINLTDE